MSIQLVAASTQKFNLTGGDVLGVASAKRWVAILARVKLSSTGTSRTIMSISRAAISGERLNIRVLNGGVARIESARIVGDTASTLDSTELVVDGVLTTVIGVADWAGGYLHLWINGVKKSLAVAGWDGPSSESVSLRVRLGYGEQGFPGGGLYEDWRVYNDTSTGLADCPPASFFEELVAAGGTDYPRNVALWVPGRGQSGVAVPTLPVLSGTVGDVSMGIATPDGSPTYGTDLTPEPPQSGVVGVRFTGSAAQYADLTGAVLAGTNAEAGLFFAGWFTASSFAAAQSLFCASTNTATAPRFGVGVDASAQVVVSGRRLDADAATTDLASTATLSANTRQFVVGQACFATGKLRVLVGSTWKEVTGVSGWTDVCSATSSAHMNIGRCVSTTQPEFGLSEQPIFGSWKVADGDPPDSWFDELRVANGLYIPAPWGPGVEIFDLPPIPDFRPGDAVPVLPIRKTTLAGVTAAGVATPANGPTFQESLLSEPMWRPRISGGASRIRTQSYWNIVGAGGLTRAASALTLEWWGELCAVPSGGGIVAISTGGSASNVRIGARLSATGLLVGSARRADADAEVTSTSAAGVLGQNHVVVTVNCATRELVAYLNGVASSAGTLSEGALTEDTDALEILIGRSLAGVNSCARHGLVTLHRRAMTPAEIQHRYRLLQSNRMPELGDAAMALDFSRERPGSSNVVRCLVRPHSCFAAPVNSPIIVPGVGLAKRSTARIVRLAGMQ